MTGRNLRCSATCGSSRASAGRASLPWYTAIPSSSTGQEEKRPDLPRRQYRKTEWKVARQRAPDHAVVEHKAQPRSSSTATSACGSYALRPAQLPEDCGGMTLTHPSWPSRRAPTSEPATGSAPHSRSCRSDARSGKCYGPTARASLLPSPLLGDRLISPRQYPLLTILAARPASP